MAWTDAIAAAGLCAVLAFAGTGFLIRLLRRKAILDHPNERSSHRQPTPRGGGIAVVGATLVVWIGSATLGFAGAFGFWSIVAATFGLAALSWFDDLRGLSPAWRLLGQAIAVAIGLTTFLDQPPIFQGLLPPAVDIAVTGVLWVWFLNLFNFMDGIDGISGVEALALGSGVAAVAATFGLSGGLVFHGATLAGAAAGFLWWNWHPARIFLGDVGSVTLGYLLGWLLLSMASEGAWCAAAILPLYYLADATLTLLKRLARGEKVWRAHAQHFYQKAVRRGFTHAQTAGAVLMANLVLIGLSVSAETGARWAALAAATFTVAALLWHFSDGRLPHDRGPDRTQR